MDKVKCLKQLISSLSKIPHEDIPGETVCDMINVLSELAEGGFGAQYRGQSKKNAIAAADFVNIQLQNLYFDSTGMCVGVTLIAEMLNEYSAAYQLIIGQLDETLGRGTVAFGGVATVTAPDKSVTAVPVTVRISITGQITLVASEAIAAGSTLDFQAGVA